MKEYDDVDLFVVCRLCAKMSPFRCKDDESQYNILEINGLS